MQLFFLEPWTRVVQKSKMHSWAEDISLRTLHRAKRELGVVSEEDKTKRRLALVHTRRQHEANQDGRVLALRQSKIATGAHVAMLAMCQPSKIATLIKESPLFIEDCQDCHTLRSGNLHLPQLSVKVALVNAAPQPAGAEVLLVFVRVRTVTD
jgi:hypothetical protein